MFRQPQPLQLVEKVRQYTSNLYGSAFSKRALHSNVPSNLVPSTFFKAFPGAKGLSLVRSLCTPCEALRNKNLRIQTCLRGWYQVRFLGLIFGHSWGNGEGPGWHLVPYLCETRKALHERHVWKTLNGSTPPICIAVLSWLLSFEERETLQYTSHLYCSMPPICTAVRPPFVRQYFWKNAGGWGHRNVSDLWEGLIEPFWGGRQFSWHHF